ncbi:MAG: hypothetical protein HQK55_09565 [Deltaproteobacteria bacterium]|nr:hypothetical protein [Deltaproteobacteria bacterium]
MTFELLARGQLFPLSIPSEGVRITPDQASLTIIGAFSDLTKDDIMAWRKGKIHYGVYIAESIPWWCISIQGFADFQCSLNIVAESQAKRDALLGGETMANMMMLFLLDFPKPIIRGMRGIGLAPEVVLEIKAACDDQLKQYSSSAEVDRVIMKIEAQISPEAIMKRAGMRKL